MDALRDHPRERGLEAGAGSQAEGDGNSLRGPRDRSAGRAGIREGRVSPR
jgi:hypothetical protein